MNYLETPDSSFHLKHLIDAYISLVLSWSKISAGDNCSKAWDATKFLERLIKGELKK